MPKRYNTPHRSRVVKTRLSEEEYADFTARLAPYGISQSEFLRQAIRRTTIRPIIVDVLQLTVVIVIEQLDAFFLEGLVGFVQLSGQIQHIFLAAVVKTVHAGYDDHVGAITFGQIRDGFGICLDATQAAIENLRD